MNLSGEPSFRISQRFTPEKPALPIEFACDDCGKQYRVRDDLVGRKIRCKECGAPLLVQGDDPEVLFDEIDEDELISASMPARRRKKSKKRSPQTGASGGKGVTFVNNLQLTALVLIAVMAIRGFGGVFLAAGMLGGGLWSDGVFSFLLAMTGIATFLAQVAIVIGGIGIFQREDYGAPLAEKGAWVLIAISLLALPGAFLTMGKLESLGIPAIIMQTVVSAVFSMAIPAALIYCLRHRDWDVPD